MTQYKKKPLPKRKIKKGQAGTIAIPVASAAAGGAGTLISALASALPFALPFEIVVGGAMADYNRQKNGDWLQDQVITMPTGASFWRPIPSKPAVEVVEEVPTEPVREEVYRPFSIDPVIDFGFEVPSLDLETQRILDDIRTKMKSFYASSQEPEQSIEDNAKPDQGVKETSRPGGGKDKQTRYKKLQRWIAKRYEQGKDLWNKSKSFNHGPLYRIPQIVNLGYDFRQWDENTPWYEKLWDIICDSTPILTQYKFGKNLSTSKIADSAADAYNQTFSGNSNEEQKEESNTTNVGNKDEADIQINMSDSIKTYLDDVDLDANTDSIR